jgi:3-oxoacyl-[acyl-carrier protein] reductase
VTEAVRVALVTGSRKGIGRFLAEHLAHRGIRVVGCSRQPSDLELEHYEHHQADVTREAEVIALLAQVRKRYGRLDVLINNAGVASMNHALLTPCETAQAVLATNLLGTFLLCRESARLMMPQRFGRIVNFSTVAVPLRLEGEAIYAASKSAVETLTRVLAYELGPYGITVNAVGPSPVETDLTRGIPPEKLKALTDRLAIKRLGTLAEVVHVVDFFLHPESGGVTGQVLYLGGAG